MQIRVGNVANFASCILKLMSYFTPLNNLASFVLKSDLARGRNHYLPCI